MQSLCHDAREATPCKVLNFKVQFRSFSLIDEGSRRAAEKVKSPLHLAVKSRPPNVGELDTVSCGQFAEPGEPSPPPRDPPEQQGHPLPSSASRCASGPACRWASCSPMSSGLGAAFLNEVERCLPVATFALTLLVLLVQFAPRPFGRRLGGRGHGRDEPRSAPSASPSATSSRAACASQATPPTGRDQGRAARARVGRAGGRCR